MIDVTRILALGVVTLALGMAGAEAQDKVTYGTNWVAQAEHGGFYQAVADGTYAKYGLDVTIRQGGPQIAGQSLLMSGQIDFYMGGSSSAINGVAEGVPMVAIAAIFQKDPQVLLAHPDAGFETFADLQKASKAFISAEATTSFWAWMKSAYPGFTDEQLVPYTFNPAPFIADKMSIQQGYITSEPLAVEKAAGFKPKVFLLADNGYEPYSTTITAMKPWLDEHKDIAKRFVEASIIGWYHYLYGDNKAANDLIKKDNPEMTDEQLAFTLKQMKDHGILVSGDAETKGIGCMTDERQKSFFDMLVGLKLVDGSIDYKAAYTTQFVCKGVGMDLVKK
jgi:NitT/TauT family transport system substrate-binding protein